MTKKTKTIFIITFIVVLIILIFLILFRKNSNKKNVSIDKNKPFDSLNSNNKNNNGGENNNFSNISVNNKNNINWKNGNSGQPSKFFQITDFAISGAGFTEENKIIKQKIKDNLNETNKTIIKTEKIPIIRYVKKQTGHIYQMNLKTKKVSKVSNTTIPNVYEVFFDNLAKNFIYRYFSTENNSIASFTTSLENKKGEFLPFGITNISLSSDKKDFFYLVKNINNTTGFIKSFENNTITKVFDSSFTDWLSQWISNNKIYLTTKPSWRINGSLFSLNTKTQTLFKIFGGIKGLTTLANSDGSRILYGNSLDVGPRLFLLNTKDHFIKNLNLYGLPEKCIWANDNIYIYCAIPNTIIGTNYPDSWYQSLVSFSDYFIKINTQTLGYNTLANSIKETPIDATHLFLNKTNTRLFFTNKKDSTLWSLNIE